MSLASAIRELVASRRARSGTGSSFEELVKYHEGKLSRAEAERVRDDIVDFPENAEIVRELAEMDGPLTREELAEVGREDMDQAFDAVWARLSATAAASVVTADSDAPSGQVRAVPRRVRPPRRPWLLAAAAALVPTLVLSVWIIRLEQQLATRDAPSAWTTVVQLSPADEGAVRSVEDPALSTGVGPTGSRPEAVSNADHVDHQGYLVFILGTTTLQESSRYTVEICATGTGEARTVWQDRDARRTEAGTFQLVVPRRFLLPGTYRVLILGHGETVTTPLADYEVRIE